MTAMDDSNVEIVIVETGSVGYFNVEDNLNSEPLQESIGDVANTDNNKTVTVYTVVEGDDVKIKDTFNDVGDVKLEGTVEDGGDVKINDTVEEGGTNYDAIIKDTVEESSASCDVKIKEVSLTEAIDDVDEDDDDRSICTEESVERNFKTFRPYIETCVKVTDLIVFYDLFTSEQSKKFRQIFKNDPTGATVMAFDEIIKMDDQPNKYLRLLDSLTEAGYPKVVRILKGMLLPVGCDHRQTIKRAAKDIFQSLVTKEVLPHLMARDVISQNDYEEISATERYYSTGSAALELLHILPNRRPDWYRQFMESLVDSSHGDLANTIDGEMVKKIKTGEKDSIYNAASWVKPVRTQSIDPIPFYHGPGEHLPYSMMPFPSAPMTYPPANVRQPNVHTDIFSRRILGPTDDMNYPYSPPNRPYNEMEKEKRFPFRSNRRSPYIPASWDYASSNRETQHERYLGYNVDSDTKTSKELLNECSPCKSTGNSKEAQSFCTDCNEYFCEVCQPCHSRMKLTRDHRIIIIQNITQSRLFSKSITCSCKQFYELDIYCKTHENIICQECKIAKHKDCVTWSINEVNPDYLEEKSETVDQTMEDLKHHLEVMREKRELEYGSLVSMVKACNSDIDNSLDSIVTKLRIMAEQLKRKVSAYDSTQKVKLEDQIEACYACLNKLIIDHGDAKKVMKLDEKGLVLESVIQMSASIKDVQKVIKDIYKDFHKPYIAFNPEHLCEGVINTKIIGELKFNKAKWKCILNLKEPAKKAKNYI